jgi:SAM-dependent methyltransferase
MNLFDKLARRFARGIDATIQAGSYVRGQLFRDLARAAIPAGGYILDYGCGPGRLSQLLARDGFRVLGVDSSSAMLTEARALDRRTLNLEFAMIEKFSECLPANTYDAIVCSSVIEYVEKPDELLQGFHRALTPSGTLIISYANRSSLWRWYWNRIESNNPMAPAQHHVWTWRSFQALLAQNGFRTVVSPRFFEWPWDWSPLGPLTRYVPFVGSLGVVAARSMPPS